MTVLGEARAFLSPEESTWEEFRRAGVLQNWEGDRLPQEQFGAMFGEQGAEITARLIPLGDRMASLVFEEFDSLENMPAVFDANPDEETNAG